MGARNSCRRSSHERRLGPNRRCRGPLLVAILNLHLFWFFLRFVCSNGCHPEAPALRGPKNLNPPPSQDDRNKFGPKWERSITWVS